MPDWDLSLVLASLAVVLALVAWLAAAGINRRLAAELRAHRERHERLERQLLLLQQSISGLTAGAVGVDRRMSKLEAREKALTERQETYENQRHDEQPYGHAIRLVHQGAGVHRLVDELDLSESEASLIVRLHGHRDTA
jgi:biopolymer transport protein ExbB/TolQ